METYFWLLAHPDDEIFGLPLFFDPGIQHHLYFMTGLNSKRRSEAETISRFLNSKGFYVDVAFCNQGIVDGRVSDALKKDVVFYLFSEIAKVKPSKLITLNFEFGHQDHDACFLMAMKISQLQKIDLIALPAYSFSCRFPGYRVMDSSLKMKFSSKNLRLFYISLRFMFLYKTQFRTWLGLGPFIAFRYLLGKWSIATISEFQFDTLGYPKQKRLYHKRNRANSDVEDDLRINFLREMQF